MPYSLADQMAYELRIKQEKTNKKWKKKGAGLGYIGMATRKKKRKGK